MKPLEQKRREAEKRQQAHDALTPHEKLKKARTRPGNSTKETLRLNRQIQGKESE